MKKLVKITTRIVALFALCSSLSACVTTDDYSGYYYSNGASAAAQPAPMLEAYDLYAINRVR